MTLRNVLSRIVAPFAVLLALTLAPAAHAQGTTGVPGFNDLTISGMFSGSSSCTPLPPFAAGTFQPFEVSTAPNVPVTFLFTLSPNCVCNPCNIPFPNQSSCPVPPNASCPTTNQSLDLVLGCGIVAVTVVSDASGIAFINVLMPPPGFLFGSQAVALHPCATPPFPFLLTQSYAVRTV